MPQLRVPDPRSRLRDPAGSAEPAFASRASSEPAFASRASSEPAFASRPRVHGTRVRDPRRPRRPRKPRSRPGVHGTCFRAAGTSLASGFAARRRCPLPAVRDKWALPGAVRAAPRGAARGLGSRLGRRRRNAGSRRVGTARLRGDGWRARRGVGRCRHLSGQWRCQIRIADAHGSPPRGRTADVGRLESRLDASSAGRIPLDRARPAGLRAAAPCPPRCRRCHGAPVAQPVEASCRRGGPSSQAGR